MKKLFFIIVLIAISGILFFFIIPHKNSNQVTLKKLWSGYKDLFISQEGRINRPKESDVVSEGQSYAMFRSVLMDDKETFDKCYLWTERHLSRKDKYGDNLLAWRWKNGAVVDWMPAADADLDYALSLLMAKGKWQDQAPHGVESYSQKAKKILKDILKKMTYKTSGGRLYLSPWIISEGTVLAAYPVNPSYYSPAHFRIFYNFTHDRRWLDLYETTYFILSGLTKKFNNKTGVGLIPDWCSVTLNDEFLPLENKNDGFGWEAVRIPFRVGLDYYWFHSKQAEGFFKGNFNKFFENRWIENKEIFCEYKYNGMPVKEYENPLFYSAYYVAFLIDDSPYKGALLDKIRSYINKTDLGGLYYEDKEEYFVNSFAWLSEFFNNESSQEAWNGR
jgi:endoglucanase